MAASAQPGNHINRDNLDAYLDRMAGLEQDAISIMMAAAKKCKDGPRAEQKELRSEMKAAGVRMAPFNVLFAIRKAQIRAGESIKDFEDADRDQLREFAQSMAGTPMGDMVQAQLDEGF